MNLFKEDSPEAYRDAWERQGGAYEQTLMDLQSTANYKPHKYHSHNYSKRRGYKRGRKHKSNLEKIDKAFGKPILAEPQPQSPQPITDKVRKSSSDSNDSTGSLTGSSRGSISSLLSDIEGVPPSEWFISRMRAMKDVFCLSWPIFLTSELLATLYFVNLLWIGHYYNSDELAGASLACTVINIMGQAFIIGTSSSLDTLCGQAYGAECYQMCGIYLQRMIGIIHILIGIIATIFLFTQQILIKLHQPHNVAKYSGIFTKYFIIALYPLGMWYCLRRYLQSQGKVKIIFPSVIFAIIGQWVGLLILDFYFDIGYKSTAISLGFAYWFQFISMLTLMFIGGIHHKTWPGWNLNQIFKGWCEILNLSVPALAMLCSEWWAFEIQAIFAGWINDTQLAGFALTLNFLTMTIKVPLSISWANGILVANKLGKMRPDDAAAAWDGSLVLSTLMTAIISIFCWFGNDLIAHLYAPQETHEAIRNVMKGCLPILAIYMMIDQVQRCGQGAIRGMGMQKIGAVTNILSYYVIGIPAGLVLCFYFDKKVKGLWYGMCCASLISSFVFISLRFRVNWREQVKKAFARIAEKKLKIETYKNNNLSNSNEKSIQWNEWGAYGVDNSDGDAASDDNNMYDNNIYDDHITTDHDDLNNYSQIQYINNDSDENEDNYEQDAEFPYHSTQDTPPDQHNST